MLWQFEEICTSGTSQSFPEMSGKSLIVQTPYNFFTKKSQIGHFLAIWRNLLFWQHFPGKNFIVQLLYNFFKKKSQIGQFLAMCRNGHHSLMLGLFCGQQDLLMPGLLCGHQDLLMLGLLYGHQDLLMQGLLKWYFYSTTHQSGNGFLGWVGLPTKRCRPKNTALSLNC